MRKWVMAIGVSFAVGLAVVVGVRLSAEAMAVVIGVVCGVVASIPTSLLVVVLWGRREEQRVARERSEASPPVVMCGGGSSGLLGLSCPWCALGFAPLPALGAAFHHRRRGRRMAGCLAVRWLVLQRDFGAETRFLTEENGFLYHTGCLVLVSGIKTADTPSVRR